MFLLKRLASEVGAMISKDHGGTSALWDGLADHTVEGWALASTGVERHLN